MDNDREQFKEWERVQFCKVPRKNAPTPAVKRAYETDQTYWLKGTRIDKRKFTTIKSTAKMNKSNSQLFNKKQIYRTND